MPRASKVKSEQPAGKTAAKPRASTSKKRSSATKKAAGKATASKAAATTKGTKPVREAKKQVPDKFLQEQKALLEAERATYEAQAAALKAEADELAQEMEPGDIQFDDESGEGGTANIDRERDLALSAQARVAVDEIDHAIAKMASGTYGKCESCGQPIPRARLKALPQARLCVACKSGGLSRR
ncbi:MAG TPA: TraR/DksA C4-type zinc finger protein [Acidimicrobiales bacterium]|nr:TraR/DksA C4-type zinc finger protein [Acidimicrobiales bacterium]